VIKRVLELAQPHQRLFLRGYSFGGPVAIHLGEKFQDHV
jgi:thioesterase domain-containing protein